MDKQARRPWAKHPEPSIREIREQLELMFGREKKEPPEPKPEGPTAPTGGEARTREPE